MPITTTNSDVIDALNIAASGLQAASAQLNAAANNIANLSTPGYSAQSVELAAAPGGGVDVDGTFSSGGPVDLPKQLVNLRRAALMYDANGMVIRMTNQMYGSLLNILDDDGQNGDQPRS
jgi:flagellar hook protein FlgE